MFRNVYYDRWKSVMHCWTTIGGARKHEEFNWTPYVYQPTDKKTAIKTIEGQKVIKKSFQNYQHYQKFQNENENIYEDRVTPEIQFLAEKYHHLNDEDIHAPSLKIFIIDIEVQSEEVEWNKKLKVRKK